MTDQSRRTRMSYSGFAAAVRGALVMAAMLGPLFAEVGSIHASPAAKFYFQLHEVQSRVALNGDLRQFAGEALKAELASRPEWESNLGGASGEDAVVAELKKRHLAGFDLVVKIADMKKDVAETSAGGSIKKLSVSVKLAVFGTTLPGNKIAFGGEGEAGAETTVSERRVDEESQSMLKDAIKDALKQAVDQAVLKLSMPKSAPLNESKRRRKKP